MKRLLILGALLAPIAAMAGGGDDGGDGDRSPKYAGGIVVHDGGDGDGGDGDRKIICRDGGDGDRSPPGE